MSSQQNCKCDCGPAQPWTCDPRQLTQNSYITPFGCKGGIEQYDPMSQQCCVCKCDDLTPKQPPKTLPPSPSPSRPAGPAGPVAPKLMQ